MLGKSSEPNAGGNTVVVCSNQSDIPLDGIASGAPIASTNRSTCPRNGSLVVGAGLGPDRKRIAGSTSSSGGGGGCADRHIEASRLGGWHGINAGQSFGIGGG